MPPSDAELRRIAKTIAYRLFQNGSGQHAEHLRQFDGRTMDAHYLGGWSEKVLEDRISEWLRDALNAKEAK